MIILDTDIIIWILREKGELVSWLEDIREREVVGVSTISMAEVHQNIKSNEYDKVKLFFSKQEKIPVSPEIAVQGGLYWNHYHVKYLKLGITDCLIAATARFTDRKLYTLNTRHFPESDIKVINPLK